MYEKIKGCICGAAIGDALGASTEMLSRVQIKETYGTVVKTFVEAPLGVLAHGRTPGNVTDDFSMAYHLIRAISNNNDINDKASLEALINWYEEDKYLVYGGPSTLGHIESIVAKTFEKYIDPRGLGGYNHMATNGCAMKIFPVGLIYGRDQLRIVEAVKTVIVPTHYTDIALSGACAIACAVGEAIYEDSTIESIIDAGISGANLGIIHADKRFNVIAGENIARKIQLAVELAKNKSFAEVVRDMSDLIGTGVAIAESVPATFGFISAFKDNTMEAIYAGVNCGFDTDTIASMVGAILGAFNGYESLNSDDVHFVSNITGYDFDSLAQVFVNING
jgi:ADP-ribosylglycohydrolase